jgi:hypothetical protein
MYVEKERSTFVWKKCSYVLIGCEQPSDQEQETIAPFLVPFALNLFCCHYYFLSLFSTTWNIS